MFIHNINPVLLNLGSLEIRYYGLIYVVGFILSYFIIKHLSRKGMIKITAANIENLLIYAGIAGILGSRLFYVLVYNFSFYLKNPFEIIAVWHGGLSIHGGIIGGLIGIYIFCKKYNYNFLNILDVISIPFVLAVALGRIGNFINGELYGKITNLPWCVKFQNAEGCRHPWQLYETIYNTTIFCVLWILKNKKLRKGMIFASFIVMYSALRFIFEFIRVPDEQLGYLFLGLTMGQILSVLLLVFGIILLYKINKK